MSLGFGVVASGEVAVVAGYDDVLLPFLHILPVPLADAWIYISGSAPSNTSPILCKHTVSSKSFAVEVGSNQDETNGDKCTNGQGKFGFKS